MRRLPDSKIARKFFVVLLVIAALERNVCLAQNPKGLPDSVGVNDTIVTESQDEKTVQTQTVDSVTEDKTDIVLPDTVVYRTVPDSIGYSYKRDPDFAYANDPAYWKKAPPPVSNNFLENLFRWMNSGWVKAIVYGLLTSVLLFALYRIIITNRLYLFYSSPKKIAAEQNDETDIHQEDLDQKIKDASLAGDYRLATRYMFLKTLKVANDKEWIRFQPKLTNFEYLQQFTIQSQKESFRVLSNAYEYVWYGKFALALPQFEWLKQKFENFYNSAGY